MARSCCSRTATPPRPDRGPSCPGPRPCIELADLLAGRLTNRTITLVSTSGGSGGDAGAIDFAAHSGGPVDAVIVLGDLAGLNVRTPLVIPWSDGVGSAPDPLVRTVASALAAAARPRSGRGEPRQPVRAPRPALRHRRAGPAERRRPAGRARAGERRARPVEPARASACSGCRTSDAPCCSRSTRSTPTRAASALPVAAIRAQGEDASGLGRDACSSRRCCCPRCSSPSTPSPARGAGGRRSRTRWRGCSPARCPSSSAPCSSVALGQAGLAARRPGDAGGRVARGGRRRRGRRRSRCSCSPSRWPGSPAPRSCARSARFRAPTSSPKGAPIDLADSGAAVVALMLVVRHHGGRRLGARPVHRAAARAGRPPVARDRLARARACAGWRARRSCWPACCRRWRSSGCTRTSSGCRRRRRRGRRCCSSPERPHRAGVERAVERLPRLPRGGGAASPCEARAPRGDEPVTVRGPLSYAGPGSLGGTESALRR